MCIPACKSQEKAGKKSQAVNASSSTVYDVSPFYFFFFLEQEKAAEEYYHRGYVSAIIKRVHKVVHRRREADTHNPKKHTRNESSCYYFDRQLTRSLRWMDATGRRYYKNVVTTARNKRNNFVLFWGLQQISHAICGGLEVAPSTSA